jgi:hypothetical protein
MKMIAVLALLAFASVAQGQFVFSGNLNAQVQGDNNTVTGTIRLRTENSDQLFFESSLINAYDVTGVHLHLKNTTSGPLFGGPLLLALTNTTTANGQAPVSVPAAGQPLVQNGQRSTANLLTNPQLTAARAKLAELGITDNNIQNIGDVDRLLRAGVVYSDVHTLQRVSPDGLVRGFIYYLPAPAPAPSSRLPSLPQSGRRLMSA